MDFLDNDVNKEIEKVTKFYKDYNAAAKPLGFSYLDNETRKFLSNLTLLQIMNFVYILGYNLANKEIQNLKNTEKERTMDYFLDLFAEKVYNKIKEKK